MSYNPNIHHRRSIRLKGYDYSQAGMYFVTICCQHRICRFGKIENGKMILNDAGKMVEKWHLELPKKFPDIELGEYVVMPNHFHAIIINTGIFVGAHLCVRPNIHVHSQNNVSILGEPEPILDEPELILGEPEPILGEHEPILGEHIGSPLRAVTQWFKTMSTNEYIRGVKTLGWQPFNKKLWQRNYYEHIIRNERAHQNISNYIIHNPEKWQNDMFHSG